MDDQFNMQDTAGDTKPVDTSTREEEFEKLKGVNLIDHLEQSQIDKIVEQVKQDRARGKKHYETDLEPKYIARQKAFRSSKDDLKKRFPELVQIVDLSDSSVQDTVESIMPSLMEIFHSAEKILNLQGVTEEDDGPAETMEDLIDWQLNRKNNFWLQSYDWLKTMLIENFSVLKVWWKREETFKRYDVVFDDMELEQLQQDSAVQIELVEQTNPPDPVTGLAIYHVRYLLRKRTANHPIVETVPNTELYYDPDAKTLEEANYVIHHKPVTVSYLRQQEKHGNFKNIDAARDTAGSVRKSQYEIMLDKALDKAGEKEDNDPGRKEVILYECYEKLSLDDSEELVDLIVTLANDTPVRIEINTMGSHPFIDLSAVRDPHRIQAHRGIVDLVQEIQDLRTILLLQMAYNVIKNNDRQAFIDASKLVDPAELRDNEKMVQVKGSPRDIVQWAPEEPFSPEVLKLMEYARNILENRVGVTAYNQGTDRGSLNKMLALDTPIPMADGSYKLNGEIVDGDIVIGSDGKPTVVLQAHPVQMPKRAFEIAFQTGDVIRAGGEHRWAVKYSNRDYKNKTAEWEKVNSERIFDLVNGGHHVFVPRVGNVDFEPKELPLDPYILGAWLGDGNSHTNRFTSMDKEVIFAFDKWSKQFYGGKIEETTQQNSGKATTYQLVNTPLRRILKDLGCLKDSRYANTRDNVKNIPQIYLQGSFEQRKALLQGLMDTDGCIDKNGNAIFCNSEPSLIDGFVKLIESFGGKPNVNWNEKPNNKFANARPHAHVTFALPFCPVTIAKKAARWKTNQNYWDKQRIVSIVEIPVEPMRCLSVSAKDELYCCGNRFTVTANTATGITAIMQAANKRISLIARIAAETGYSKLFRRLIFLNQTFCDEQTVMRVTNRQRIVRPDDIGGDMDIIVNSGIGTGTKNAELQSLQILLGMYDRLVQAGIATRAHVAYAMAKLIENMGFKNVQDFIRRPEEIAAEDEQAAIIQQRTAETLAAAGVVPAGGSGPAGAVDPRIAGIMAAAGAGRAAG